jgi:hypothetical protein
MSLQSVTFRQKKGNEMDMGFDIERTTNETVELADRLMPITCGHSLLVVAAAMGQAAGITSPKGTTHEDLVMACEAFKIFLFSGHEIVQQVMKEAHRRGFDVV